MSIRIGIYGYGNLGRGVEAAIKNADDAVLSAVFTRRAPSELKLATDGVKAYAAAELGKFTQLIDVLILCGGSATDLPVQTPECAKLFNVVDSFDTHADINRHFAAVNAEALRSGHVAVISGGWDPGLFSIARCYAGAVLPNGRDYTFWGRGVSQGHSDALRRIKGVLDARQYTVPVPTALAAVRSGAEPALTTRQKHTRDCYVVAAPDADRADIETQIKTMPNYFADYDTTVTFVTAEELKKNHSELPHGGTVIRTGATGWTDEYKNTVEYSLKLDSNPMFTASVIVAYARAAYRLHARGEKGARTVLDIAPALISPLSDEELRARIL